MSAKYFRIFPEGDTVQQSSEHVPDSAITGSISSVTRAADGAPRYRGAGRAAHRGNGRTTLASIAAAAGVSLPTVSKVVNGRPDVAAATRAKVERLLDEHHYARTGTRRGHRSGLVDLVFNGLDSPWAVEILRGVEEWGASHQ